MTETAPAPKGPNPAVNAKEIELSQKLQLQKFCAEYLDKKGQSLCFYSAMPDIYVRSDQNVKSAIDPLVPLLVALIAAAASIANLIVSHFDKKSDRKAQADQKNREANLNEAKSMRDDLETQKRRLAYIVLSIRQLVESKKIIDDFDAILRPYEDEDISSAHLYELTFRFQPKWPNITSDSWGENYFLPANTLDRLGQLLEIKEQFLVALTSAQSASYSNNQKVFPLFESGYKSLDAAAVFDDLLELTHEAVSRIALLEEQLTELAQIMKEKIENAELQIK